MFMFIRQAVQCVSKAGNYLNILSNKRKLIYPAMSGTTLFDVFVHIFDV